MATLITLTKIGIFDSVGSRFAVDSESIRVIQNNISSIETDSLGSIVMLTNPQELDGNKIYGYVVSQTPAQIQTLIDTTSSTVAASDGTVGAPSISFANDPDCGLYEIGANNQGYAVNGAKVLDLSTAGLSVTGALTVSTRLTTQSLVRKPVTTTTVAAGSLITGAMIATGYIEVTGTTNSSALDSAANITTALGTSPIGTTFDFILNTMGATPMTSGNVLTITAGANTQFMKQISAGDSASAFLATVTATAGTHLAHFRVTYDTATTITIQRIG